MIRGARTTANVFILRRARVMTTPITTLLHDIEEYFVKQNVGPGKYPHLHPIDLLRRAHELIVDLDDRVYTLQRDARRYDDDCTCWRGLDDNVDP
jgi:hypothetical protein